MYTQQNQMNNRRRIRSSISSTYEKVVLNDVDFEVIKSRNCRVVDLFRQAGYRLRLTGNHQYPNFVFNDKFRIHALIKDETISIYKNFNDKGSVYIEMAIDSFNKDWLRTDFLELLSDIERRSVYMIRDLNTQSNLVEYGKNRKMPIFSANKEPKIFLTRDFCDSTMKELSKFGLNNLTVIGD